MTALIERPSPNFDFRREGCPIDILVLHYTGMQTAEEALARLCDPAAIVSAHYTIDRDGSIYRHVDESLRARHAGVSYWAGERDVNSRSIGIELVNPGHEFGYEPFPETQIAALIDLARGILIRHSIPSHRVIGHSDVAPARKSDPGELFPWWELANAGIGIFPPAGSAPAAAQRIEGDDDICVCTHLPSGALANIPSPAAVENLDVAGMLKQFGYGVPPEVVDTPLDMVVTAFQRHFRPGRLDGVADAETKTRLAALLEMLE